jgi:hypothetical protein
MIYEMTVQVRDLDMNKQQSFYQVSLNRAQDFTSYEGFAELELLPNCWLQVAEGLPAFSNGTTRLGVVHLNGERRRLIETLEIKPFEIFEREEVPVRLATFSDPCGNHLGLFEDKVDAASEEKFQPGVRR